MQINDCIVNKNPQAQGLMMPQTRYYDLPPDRGWQCPVCGRVYAPFVTVCPHCGNGGNTIQITYETNKDVI